MYKKPIEIGKLSLVMVLLIATSVAILPIATNLKAYCDGDAPYFEEVDGVGTYFELSRFNVYVATGSTVHMLLRACSLDGYSSERISYYIEGASGAASAQITFGYLKPSETYYIIGDSPQDERAFTTDNTGSYTYTQDLSRRHCIFVQPMSSTLFISTSTTLHSDIYQAVWIIADNIVLDLNGYSIIGPVPFIWFGIRAGLQHNVIIENGRVTNWILGMYFDDCTNFQIRNMTMDSNGWSEIEMSGLYDSLITENTFSSRPYALEQWWTSSGNMIYHNNFMGGHCRSEGGYHNAWDDGYPSGGNYWSWYTGSDMYHGPNQDIPGSDGIGDSWYVLSAGNIDHYPLMNPWKPTETLVKNEPVAIISNAAIDQIVATKNNLKFTASGPTGQKGYINLIFPMINTTDINVQIDKQKPASPFPTITTNGTHYFIYFEFTLSTHTVAIQFAPCKLTVNTDPPGLVPTPSVDPASPDGFYEGGTVVTLTANAVSGYTFQNWEVNPPEASQPQPDKIEITMDQDYTATAVYTFSLNVETGFKPGDSPSYASDPCLDDVLCVLTKTTGGYRLVGTSPGTFDYAVAIENVGTTPFASISISVNGHSDFCLQSLNPIRVLGASGSDVTAQFTLSGTWPTIMISNQSTFAGLAASSSLYVTVHLDYNLKGQTFDSATYNKGYTFTATVSGTSGANQGSKSASGSVAFLAKKATALYGFLTDTCGNPMAGAEVDIIKDGQLLYRDSTDADGFYCFINGENGVSLTGGIAYTVSMSCGRVYTQNVTAVSQTALLVNFRVHFCQG